MITLEAAEGSEYALQLEHNEIEPYVCTPRFYKNLPSALQCRGIAFMIMRESRSVHGQRGGLICDALGIGKTMQCLATIVEQLHAVRTISGESQKTLVVASANVMHEWLKQSATHIHGRALRVASYYGANRVAPLPDSYDVLVTTYGVVQREYSRDMHLGADGLFTHWHARGLERSPFERNFDRIILDEAHNIRNRKTAVHEAVCALNGEAHWAITATPVYNSLADLYALIKFVNASPYCVWQVFESAILNRLLIDPQGTLMTIRRFLLPMQLRRSKTLLNLPPLTETSLYVELSASERLFYNALRDYSRDTVRRLLRMEGWLRTTGWARSNTNLRLRAQQCTLSTILRLRQACVHPQLAIAGYSQWRSEPLDEEFQLRNHEPRLLEEAARRLTEMLDARRVAGDGVNEEECAICYSEAPEHCLVPCGHVLGPSCAEMLFRRPSAVSSHVTCPLCRRQVTSHKPVADALREATEPMDDDEDGEDEDADDVVIEREWTSESSKIAYVMNHFSAELARDHTSKALIFSQWRGSLDAVGKALTQRHITFLRVDGTVSSAKTRSDYQDRFNNDASIQVMLSSLNCSSEGINLQGANIVYLLDLWWNDAKESQAAHRSHRVGQTRPVSIYHIVARNTIEERVLALQQRKRALADAADGTRAVDDGDWAQQVRSLLGLDDDDDDDESASDDDDDEYLSGSSGDDFEHIH